MPSLTRRSEQPGTASTSTPSTPSTFSTGTFSTVARSAPQHRSRTSAPLPRQRMRHRVPALDDVGAEDEPFPLEAQRAQLIAADPFRIQRAFDMVHDTRAVRRDVVRAEVGDVAEVRGADLLRGALSNLDARAPG